MLRAWLAVVFCLLLPPWQACQATDTDLQAAIQAESELLMETGQLSAGDRQIAASDLIGHIYVRRGFAPAWGSPAAVASLLTAVRSSYDDGLDPADYHLSSIEQLQQILTAGRELPFNDQAVFDLTLTDGLIRLVYDQAYGKVNPETPGPAWTRRLPLDEMDPEAVIEKIIASDSVPDAIAAVVPRGRQYQRLKSQLLRHRALAEQGGWPEVPEGPTIRPDADDPRLPVLAERLAVSGDLLTAEPPAGYDLLLQEAVRRFQARHGLEADALVGKATLGALNVSIEERIDQIRLNLERGRWLSGARPDDAILVNIPAFTAEVVRGGQIIWTTKVIVGETEDETPVFHSMLKHIVINPTWTVPRRIASEEMLPKIKRDRDFMEKGGYELRDSGGNVIDPGGIDWSTITKDYFPFTLVQRPGPANQLGRIKFMFPNEYSVCMHDTPGKFLFEKSSRAFSHGCIRVDEPFTLAEILLHESGWTKEQIFSQVDSGETKTVVLAEPLPMLLLYRTAEVDDQGVMHFYTDIYERDTVVLSALDKSD